MLQWLRTHNLAWLLVIGMVFTFDWLMLNKKRLKLNWYQSLLTTIGQTAIGLFFSMLFAWIEVGFDFSKAASIRMYGLIFFYPLVYYAHAKVFKTDTRIVFDTFFIATIVFMFLARINCLISGCCGAIPIGPSAIRLPIREVEMVLNAVYLLIAAPKVYKGKTTGRVYPIYLIVYGIYRFVIEFVREEGDTILGIERLHLAHVWSLISIAAGIIILAIMAKKEKSVSNNKLLRRA